MYDNKEMNNNKQEINFDFNNNIKQQNDNIKSIKREIKDVFFLQRSLNKSEKKYFSIFVSFTFLKFIFSGSDKNQY